MLKLKISHPRTPRELVSLIRYVLGLRSVQLSTASVAAIIVAARKYGPSLLKRLKRATLAFLGWGPSGEITENGQPVESRAETFRRQFRELLKVGARSRR